MMITLHIKNLLWLLGSPPNITVIRTGRQQNVQGWQSSLRAALTLNAGTTNTTMAMENSWQLSLFSRDLGWLRSILMFRSTIISKQPIYSPKTGITITSGQKMSIFSTSMEEINLDISDAGSTMMACLIRCSLK